jgi:dTMP kinase
VLLDHPEPVPGYDVPPPPALSPRTEALLFAADRAEHVASVVRPALALGHVVISDRYTDSSVAYQGAGRDLAGAEVGRLSRWATDGLQPHLTVLLDLPAADGLARVVAPDRLESEPLAFHERVRDRFLELARRGGARYLVVDGTQPAALVTAAILARLEPVLPPSAQQLREAELAREAEEQRRRIAEEVRRLEEARARAEAEDLARREAAEAEVRLAQAAAEAAALAEQQRVQEEAAAAERARLAALSEAEAAQAREEHARLRALHAEERRREKEEHRHAREAAHRQRAAYGGDVAADDDPATRPLSLTDELFGIGDEGDDDTSTVQMPRAEHGRDDR